MLKQLGGAILIVAATAASGNAQVYDYNYEGKTDHAGLQFDFNQNMGSSLVDKDGTKSTFAPFARLGLYLKRQISKSFYLRAAVMYGNGNFSYKYPQGFNATSDTSYPIGNLGRRGISIPVIEPEIAIGYFFRFNQKHQVDLRLGVSAPLYVSRYNNFYDTTYTNVALNKGTHTVRFSTTDQFQTNYKGDQWGMVNTNLFIGYKRIHYNDFSDRLGIGLTFGFTVYNKNAGIATYRGDNVTYNYNMWERQHKLTYLSAGIRLEYDIF
ncbi:MAG: hypothetical protein JNM21_09065 [Taibaiella sp.]|nr:hypothetical protein [Taibaiella sp.]